MNKFKLFLFLIIFVSNNIFAGKSKDRQTPRKHFNYSVFENSPAHVELKQKAVADFEKEIKSWQPMLQFFATKYLETLQALELRSSSPSTEEWLFDCLTAFLDVKEMPETDRLQALIKILKLKICQEDYYYAAMVYINIYHNAEAGPKLKAIVLGKLAKLYASEHINHIKKTKLDISKVLDVILTEDSPLSSSQAEAILLFSYRLNRNKIIYIDASGVEFTMQKAAILLTKVIKAERVSPVLRLKAQYELVNLLVEGKIKPDELRVADHSLNYITALKLLDNLSHDENVSEMLKVKTAKLRLSLNQLLNEKNIIDKSAEILLEMMLSKSL